MELQDARVLVTGGTGHLGAALIHYLVEQGLSPSRIRAFYLSNTPTGALDELSGLDLQPGNILDPDDVRAAFDSVTHVFHVAGNTSFDPGRKAIQWLVNVEGTRNVCRASLESPTVERVVHTSTVNTLGIPEPSGSLGTENSSPYHGQRRLHSFASRAETLAFADAVNEGRMGDGWQRRIGIGYFDSKLAAEEVFFRFVREEGLQGVAVLPGTNYGPHDFLIGNTTYLLALYHNRLPACSARTGFPLTHVCDQAMGHLLAMTRGRIGERYIISGRPEDNLPMSEMVAVIVDVLRSKEPSRSIRMPSLTIPLQVAYVAGFFSESWARLVRQPCLLSRDAVRAGSFPGFYSCRKARTELGYEPRRTFRQAVGDMYEYARRHGLLEELQRHVDA